MTSVLLIGLGGFLGAMARYLVDLRVSTWTGGAMPWGTFAVNVSGSLLAGVLFALLVERAVLTAELRGPLMTGRSNGRWSSGGLAEPEAPEKLSVCRDDDR
jgi:CrcB protein